ncbi:hypothetical protein TNCV_1710801 [Trichonephila clavipes]|nr:hypothetical protein TNCV_1710801 [Trichonephila clavipes]
MQVKVRFSSVYHPNLEREHPEGGSGALPYLSSLSSTLTIGFSSRRLFRVSPCRKDTIHLQTSVPSQGFEPRAYGTAVSVSNHYTGRATVGWVVCAEHLARQGFYLLSDI